MNFLEAGLIDALKPVGGGWRYLQAVDGRAERIPFEGSADSARALVEAVALFRLNNGIPAGDPFADVVDFIRKVSPPNDRFKGRAKLGVERVRETVPIIYDLRAWLDKTAASHPQLCSLDEATERALICQHCPQNIKWTLDGCGDCNADIEYRAACLRRSPEFILDGVLRACRLHRVQLGSAVFIDRDALPARHPEAPEPCWIGRAPAPCNPANPTLPPTAPPKPIQPAS